MLASTLFLVQNDYYNWILERTRTQDNARSVTEMVADDLRSVVPGGFLVAQSNRMVIRRPLAVGVVCDIYGSVHTVHIPGGRDGFRTGDVSGFGLRASDGTWTFTNASWGSMFVGTSFAAFLCAGEGADTVGARSDFHLFGDLASMSGMSVSIGDVIMFYRNLEITFGTSQIHPATRALYRGTAGGTLVEFATGLDDDARFNYRTGDSNYVASVTGADLGAIDGVRVHALTEAAVLSVRREDVEFDLVTDLLLRNAG